MKEVKNIEKDVIIHEGSSSEYRAVSDKKTREVIGQAMIDAGLAMVPVSTEAHTDTQTYQDGDSIRRTTLTEVNRDYMLIHADSNSHIIVNGYGHGIDHGDKGAAKATTFALKNLLLDMFLVPKGDMDDGELTPSAAFEAIKGEDITDKKDLEIGSEDWVSIQSYIKDVADSKSITAVLADIKRDFKLNPETRREIRRYYKEASK